MAKINLDNLVNDLRDRNAAKQDRVIVSGSLAGMRMPPAVLFHPWRQPSPGSLTESESLTTTLAGETTPASVARKPEAARAGRSGFPATGGAVHVPFAGHQLSVGHDCQSNVCRDARPNGSTGYRPGYATASAGTNGK